MPQTSGSGGSGELPGTGDLIPDTNTRVIGNTDHRWKELVVEDIQASDTITTNSIQTATATVGGVMSAGQTSVSELTILQSNDDGSLLTGAGTGTFRIRRGASELDTTAISLTDHSIELIRVNGDAGLSLNTLNGTTTASSSFQANHISSATDINALGGTVTGQVLQGNINVATPLVYVTSIQPIDSEAATIGTSSNRWKSLWARLINTTDMVVTGSIQAASQTLSSSLSAASLTISGVITAAGQITGSIVQANTNLAAPLLYVNQILPISYALSTLGTASNYWKEAWISNINTGTAAITDTITCDKAVVNSNITGSSANSYNLFTTTIVPKDSSFWTLGNLTHYWDHAYVNNYHGTTASVTGTITSDKTVVNSNISGSSANSYNLYTTSLIPKDINYWNLGSSAARWASAYVNSYQGTNATLTGTVTTDDLVVRGLHIGNQFKTWFHIYNSAVSIPSLSTTAVPFVGIIGSQNYAGILQFSGSRITNVSNQRLLISVSYEIEWDYSGVGFRRVIIERYMMGPGFGSFLTGRFGKNIRDAATGGHEATQLGTWTLQLDVDEWINIMVYHDSPSALLISANCACTVI